MSETGTTGPISACSCEVRGSCTPAAAHTCWVRPEQSNSPGPVAPHTYGLPSSAYAVETAVIARLTSGAGIAPGLEAATDCADAAMAETSDLSEGAAALTIEPSPSPGPPAPGPP